MLASKWRSPVRVRDVLVPALPELGDRLVEEAIRAAWSSLIGGELGRRSRPERLKGGILEVMVDNSPCLQELTLRAGQVLATVRAQFRSVSQVRFALGTLPSRDRRVTRTARPQTQAKLSPQEIRAVEAMAATLPDPILAGGLRRLLTKDLLARRQRDGVNRHGGASPAEKEST